MYLFVYFYLSFGVYVQLISLRGVVRIVITSKAIIAGSLGFLDLFTYNIMGFIENALLLIIPYLLASIR